MSRLRIGPRLALVLAVMVLLAYGGIAVGIWQVVALRDQAARLHQLEAEAAALLQVHNDMLALNGNLQQAANARDPARFAAEATTLRNRLAKDVEQATTTLTRMSTQTQDPGYTGRLNRLADISGVLFQIDRMAELAQTGDWPAVEHRLETELRPAVQSAQTLAQETGRLAAAERAQTLDTQAQTTRQAVTWLAAIGLVTLLVAVLLGSAVAQSIIRPLARLNTAAAALAHRQFDRPVGLTGNDELAGLGRTLDDAAFQLQALYLGLEKQVWERTNELHRRAMQLETSLAVGQRAASILDPAPLLDQVVNLIKERYGYDFVGVFLPDKTGQELVARAGTGQTGNALRRQEFRLRLDDDSLIGWVAGHRRLNRIDDVLAEPRYIHLDIAPDTRSELALPLVVGRQMLGVLDIRSNHVRAFNLDDLPVLQSLADQIAIAVQNARLYKRERSRRQLAETLYHAGRSISGTLELAEVLNLVLEHLADIVSYDRASVMLQRNEALEILAAKGFPDEVNPLNIRVPIKQDDVYQNICHTRQPLSIPDVLQRPDWQYVVGLPPARAWLGIPLTRFNNVFGILSVTRLTPGHYDEDEIALAAAFAGQAAIALENARLYEKITRFTQQLEDMVRERTEAFQDTLLQLEHLDRAKSDFINIAAHELRTPLTVLQGYSSMLLGDPVIKQNALQLELISSIHAGAIRLHEVVNSMLDVAKIDNRALKLYPEPVSVRALLELVCQKLTATLQERNLTLNITLSNNLPSIEADPDALAKVFYHLATNAIKYTPDGGEITISGHPVTTGTPDKTVEAIEIIVSDTGIGIAPEFHDLIFTKFYQTGELALHSSSKTRFKGAGPGLGLAIVRGIVEAHQGKVWVESPGYNEETCPGSRFHVSLPLRQQPSRAASGSGSTPLFPPGRPNR